MGAFWSALLIVAVLLVVTIMLAAAQLFAQTPSVHHALFTYDRLYVTEITRID